MKYNALIFIFLVSILQGQDFKNQPLVTLPGQNKNYVLTESFGGDAYICFENLNNDVYSIYLQHIYPYDTNLVVIVADTTPQINPTFTYTEYYTDLKIVWQSEVNGYWQLFSREYKNGILAPTIQMTNDSTNNIEPSISGKQLFWLRDKKLVYANNYYPQFSFQIIDSSSCSSPYAYFEGDNVIYEQGKDSLINIKSAWKNYDYNWIYTVHSDSGYNICPKYGTFSAFSYQKYENGVWKGVVENWVSNNRTYNVTNPFYFIIPLITKPVDEGISDIFVVYESDSLQTNKDIFLEYIQKPSLSKLNISNSTGDDRNPYAIWMGDSIGIFWEHWENSISQIWCAKAKSGFSVGIHSSSDLEITSFYLAQNYPNPFNPNTRINFQIIKPSKVVLKIYNLLGEEIKTLVSKSFDSGFHTVEWNGTNNCFQPVSSGVYVYVLESADFKLSKKMVLIR